jgi:hypothetical protein
MPIFAASSMPFTRPRERIHVLSASVMRNQKRLAGQREDRAGRDAQVVGEELGRGDLAERPLQRVEDVGERPGLDVAVVRRHGEVREQAEHADVLEPAAAGPARSSMPGAEWWPYCPPCRPIAHSTQRSGIPIRTNEMRYGMRNAPPPFWAACAGKRRKLPSPTALPAIASTSPTRVPHCSFSVRRYTKIHPFSFAGEEKVMASGGDVVTWEVEGLRVTPLVCYDLRFPEPFRLAAEETDLYAVVANWPERRRHHWSLLLRARAVENLAFVAGVNRVGEGGDLRYLGDSALVGPWGETIVSAAEQETVLVADVSPSAVAEARRKFPALADRRPASYRRRG